jgi:hypothetical protein
MITMHSPISTRKSSCTDSAWYTSAGRPGRSTRRTNPAPGLTYWLRSGRPRKTKSSDSKMQQACVASLFIQAASRALTTNHPTVTGVRPDSTGSSRASSIIEPPRTGARCAREHPPRQRPRVATASHIERRVVSQPTGFGGTRVGQRTPKRQRIRTVSSDAQCAGTAQSYQQAIVPGLARGSQSAGRACRLVVSVRALVARSGVGR